MNILIVDDEKPCRIVIINYLRQIHDVKLIKEANTVSEALDQINSFSPNLIFLDIKLKNETGFDLLDKVSKQTFQIVFTTAYDNYAVKAFDYAAIHYLLKPISKLDIKDVITRAKAQQFQLKKETIEEARFLFLKTEEKAFNINLANVTYLEAEGSYSRIYFVEGKSIFSAKNVGEFEKELPNYFYRIHRSILVNMRMVLEVHRKNNTVSLINKISLPISRRKRKDFRLALQNKQPLIG